MSLKTTTTFSNDTLETIYNRAPRYIIRNYEGKIFSVPNSYVEKVDKQILGGGKYYWQGEYSIVNGQGWDMSNSLFTTVIKELNRDRFTDIKSGVSTALDGTNYYWPKEKSDKKDYDRIKNDEIPGYKRLSIGDGSLSNPYLIARNGSKQYDVAFPLYRCKSKNDFIKEHLTYLTAKNNVKCNTITGRSSDTCVLACDNSKNLIDSNLVQACWDGSVTQCIDSDNYKKTDKYDDCKTAITNAGENTNTKNLITKIATWCADPATDKTKDKTPNLCKEWWSAYDHGSTTNNTSIENKYIVDIMKEKYYNDYCKNNMLGTDEFCSSALNSKDEIVQNNLNNAITTYYTTKCAGDKIKTESDCVNALSSSHDFTRETVEKLRDTWCSADTKRLTEKICYPQFSDTTCSSTGTDLINNTSKLIPVFKKIEDNGKVTNGATFIYYTGLTSVEDTNKAFQTSPILINYFNHVNFATSRNINPNISNSEKKQYYAVRILANLEYTSATAGYKLRMKASNSATLYLNNIKLLDITTGSTAETQTMGYSITLTKDQIYFLRIDYKVYTTTPEITLEYQQDGTTTWTAIPSTWFKPYKPLTSISNTYKSAFKTYCNTEVNSIPRYQTDQTCTTFISKEDDLNSNIKTFCDTGNNWLDNSWCENLTMTSSSLNQSLKKDVLNANINKMATLAKTIDGKTNQKVIDYFKNKYLLDLKLLGLSGDKFNAKVQTDILNSDIISYIEISDPEKTTAFSKMLYTTYKSYDQIKNSENRLKDINCMKDARFLYDIETHILLTNPTIANKIILPSTANSTKDYYKDWNINIISAQTGSNQVKKITAYDSTKQELTLESNLSPIPTIGTGATDIKEITVELIPINYAYCKDYANNIKNFNRFIPAYNTYCNTGNNIATNECQDYYNNIQSKIVQNHGCSDTQLGLTESFENKQINESDSYAFIYIFLFIFVVVLISGGTTFYMRYKKNNSINKKI